MKQLKEKEILLCADSALEKRKLAEMFAWRSKVLSTNEFIADETPFELRLCGVKINFKPSSSFTALETFQEVFIDGGHCRHEAFLPSRAGFILDIGANQGLYALKVRSENPACGIVSFEPNPFEFEFLKMNFASNSGLMRGAGAEMLAAAGRPGRFEMEVIPQMGPIGGLSLRGPGRKWIKDSFVRKVSAEALTLDQIFEKYTPGRVDILKMDVEGAELEILAAFGGFDRFDKAVIEYHSAEGEKALKSLMAARGFGLVFDDRLPGDVYGDAYFLRM